MSGGGMKKLDAKTVEELRRTANSVLASLTPREAKVLRMKFGMRVKQGLGVKPIKINSVPDKEESDLRALLKESVALKHKKKS